MPVIVEEPPPPAGSAGPEPRPEVDVAVRVLETKPDSPAAMVSRLGDLFLAGELPAAARAKLEAYVGEGNPKDRAQRDRVREAAQAVMSLPEYQLS
jgi:hypothetical protein